MRPCLTVSIGVVSSCTAGTIRSDCCFPSRRICNCSGWPAWARIVSCRLLQPSIGSPSMATILSPYFSPATAAGDCGFTYPTCAASS